MKSSKVLFPTDFSTLSDAALQHATTLAKERGAKLLIVHVEEPPPAYAGEMYYGLTEPDQAQLKKMLQAVVPPDASVPYEHRLVIGEPATEITELAKSEDVDLVVLATHGRTGLMRLLMGSVAEAVVRQAPCPVLTIRHPEPVAAAK